MGGKGEDEGVQEGGGVGYVGGTAGDASDGGVAVGEGVGHGGGGQAGDIDVEGGGGREGSFENFEFRSGAYEGAYGWSNLS